MNEALQLRDGRWFVGNPGPMRSPAEIKASFSQISSCWLTKLMNILQKAINSLLLRIIALVFVFGRDSGRSVYSVVKNKAVNSRNFSIFEVPENLIGLGLLSKLVSGLTASQTAKEHSYRAILRSLDFGRAVLFSVLELNVCPWKVKKSSPSSGKNNKKRGK